MSDLVATLREQEQAWQERPLVRRLYREWHRALVERLSNVDGVSIELGSGIGRLREVAGTRVVLTDVEQTPWSDEAVDALHLRYTDGSLANIVMLDVFHHLADPARFLDEVERTLASGGRLLMIEPYCSPISTPLYRRFHQERTDTAADPFAPDSGIAHTAFDSNQALPTLVFFRRVAELQQRWPTLRLVEQKRSAFLVYPLSGGFTRRPLLPRPLYPVMRLIEHALRPLAPALAFRCLVVLEKS
ncbi:MAG: class I SAM-dependent methyltransferase [Gaiellaceae bacterium]